MVKISTNISTTLNPFSPRWNGTSQKTKESRAVGEQVQDALFGKNKPPCLNPDEFPETKKILALLNSYRRKFAMMAGDPEEEYRLQLADGTLAMIDEQGTIFIGIGFLRQFKNNTPVLIGALAHEIGHRPQRWQKYKTKKELNKQELDSLCRYEETCADLFAGRALAEVNLSCNPMIAFLEDVEEGPHPEYFPASLRGEVIREGYESQKSMATVRKKQWPELDKQTAARLHIGEY
jgi:hypothetical protein